MKRATSRALGLLSALLASALLGACATTPSRQAAVMQGPAGALCQQQMLAATEKLTGHAVPLPSDAFSSTSSYPLITVGHAADGKMAPPTQALQLQTDASGVCRMALRTSEAVAVALPACSCKVWIPR